MAKQRKVVGGTADNTGLTHLDAREYDPEIGRFISVDPAQDLNDPQQWNAYVYANNSPVTFSDPDGRVLIGDHYGLVKAIPQPDGSSKIVDNRPKPLSPQEKQRVEWIREYFDAEAEAKKKWKAYLKDSLTGDPADLPQDLYLQYQSVIDKEFCDRVPTASRRSNTSHQSPPSSASTRQK